MRSSNILQSPIWLFQIAGTAKSLRKNPILANAWLNTHGLHRKRVQLAAAMADRRRQVLARSISAEDRAQFDENGFILTENFLPESQFSALKAEVLDGTFSAREMRQGHTVTRMIPTPPRVLNANPALAQSLRDHRALNQIRYASSRGGRPTSFLQTVLADPSIEGRDPQTDLHTDTFHSTAKAWLFLRDVGEDDGPVCYVPGSHKLTPERLNWQHNCALSAMNDPRAHQASGSFRICGSELQALGLPPAKRLAVKANTLLVADTFGFHGRTQSEKSTVRIELRWHMRRNPFLPWTGLDVKAFPGLKERDVSAFLKAGDMLEKRFGVRHIWRDVGAVRPESPANI